MSLLRRDLDRSVPPEFTPFKDPEWNRGDYLLNSHLGLASTEELSQTIDLATALHDAALNNAKFKGWKYRVSNSAVRFKTTEPRPYESDESGPLEYDRIEKILIAQSGGAEGNLDTVAISLVRHWVRPPEIPFDATTSYKLNPNRSPADQSPVRTHYYGSRRVWGINGESYPAMLSGTFPDAYRGTRELLRDAGTELPPITENGIIAKQLAELYSNLGQIAQGFEGTCKFPPLIQRFMGLVGLQTQPA